MEPSAFDRLRLELSVNAKNGVDFIASATLVWILVGYIWTLPYSAYDRSVLTFIVGGITIPLAFGLSKVFKTKWKSPGNPLDCAPDAGGLKPWPPYVLLMMASAVRSMSLSVVA